MRDLIFFFLGLVGVYAIGFFMYSSHEVAGGFLTVGLVIGIPTLLIYRKMKNKKLSKKEKAAI